MALTFFKTCISTSFSEAIHTQQYVEGAHLPLPYSEALVQQSEAGLKQCSLVKTIKITGWSTAPRTSSSTGWVLASDPIL